MLPFSMNYQIVSGRLKLPWDLLPRHSAIYKVNPLTGEGLSGFENDFAGIELLGREAAEGCKFNKGTIQFPWSKPMPYELIAEITRFRVQRAIKKQI